MFSPDFLGLFYFLVSASSAPLRVYQHTGEAQVHSVPQCPSSLCSFGGTQALSTNHPVPIITKMTQTFIITNFPQCINVGTSKIRFVAISCDVNDKCGLQRLQPGGKAFIHIVVPVIISLSVWIYQKCTVWIINRQAFQYFTSRRKETNLKLTASICFRKFTFSTFPI